MKLYWVNSFTTTLFKGNPAGVCISNQPLAEETMQAVAKELGLSETAFCVQQPNGHWQIRFFTPTTEVPLCGHATLASAHILWTERYAHPEFPLHFKALDQQTLEVTLKENVIEMVFPEKPLKQAKSNETKLYENIIQAPIQQLYQTTDKEKFIAILENESLVQNIVVNLETLKQQEGMGVVVTAQAAPNKPYQVVSRYFAPQIGIDEDPVTGVAHCAIGPYWIDSLKKDQIIAYQASTRGGMMQVRRHTNNQVVLSGQAVTLFGGAASANLLKGLT